MDSNNEIPEVSFGSQKASETNWRKVIDNSADIDTDEELAETPAEIINLLGFDPLELESI